MSEKDRPLTLKLNKRIKNGWRKFTKDNSGVSEVLGDILLVSMSVVLVSVIAYQVSNIQTPIESTKIDLVASIDQDHLLIKHMGGEKLDEDFIKIHVGTGSIVTDIYNISDGMSGDRTWSIGEVWSMNISAVIATSDATNSQIFVQVIDTRQDTIVLDQILRKGLNTEQFPDIGIDKTSFSFSQNNPENNVFININVKIVNYGPVNVTNINVRFFDGKDFIGANNTITKLNFSGLPDDNRTVSLRWRTPIIGKHIISAKVVPKFNETNLANNYLSKDLIVGAGVNPDFIKPNLILKSLAFSKETPKSKETVIVTAEVGNTAKVTATGFQLRWGDDFEGINSTINITTYSSNVTYVKGAIIKFEWTPQKGGSHTFWANIENVLPSGEDAKADADPDLDRDYLEQQIEVLPTILLVDDDRAGRGSVRDTVTHMREALKVIGISPDLVTVSGGDGPQYTGTAVTLDDYDVVIWMCGYESTNTLTTTGPTNDIGNLKSYLDNGGALWVIGQDITDDLWTNGGIPGRNFLANYLHVSGQTLNVGVTSTIVGNDNNNVVAGMSFKTSVPSGQPNRADMITPNGAVSAMDNSTNKNLSLLSNQSTRSDSNEYRVAFFAFEFAHITFSSDRAILTYQIMQWFNATVSLDGDDLAVSEVTITPNNPHFKQEVAIKATIRNNGLNDLSGVKVVFKEVFMGVEHIIDSVAVPDPKRAPNPLTDSPDTNNPMSVDLSGKGGINITYKYWTPDRIGLHAIKVVVDPNDVIKEFNEENNEFQSILDPTDVFVDSISLVVDDDHVAAGAQNTTKAVTDVLDFLNYKYEVYTVSALTSNNGPGINNLTKYNSIIWVLGGQTVDTLKNEDTTNLSSYLTNYDDSKLMIVGQGLANDNNFWSNTSFRHNLLGLGNGVSKDVGTPSILHGVVNNNITHGVEYTTTTTFADGADDISPGTGAESVLENSAGTRTFGVAFHNTTGVDYKVLTLGFEYGFIDQANFRNEFMFNVLRWFGQIDSRIELRVAWDDLFFGQDNGPTIDFSDQNPVLGDSYILQAKVWNLGGTPGGAVVRFVDGTTVINSVNVYVAATSWDSNGNLIPGTAIAEVIWTPLFAGNRPITVKIDPDQNVPLTSSPRDTTGEIFKFNNNATRDTEVFFFHDDMESGTANWDHDATILNINGEQPIEYFDRLRPVDTNLIDDFDWANSKDWQKFLTDGHSLPSSFKMSEPLNQNLSTAFNLKVAICIDDSGSMAWNDPSDIRLDAAKKFVENVLVDGDQVAVYQFETYWDPINDKWVSWWDPGRLVVRNLFYYFDSGNTTTFEPYPFNNTTKKYLNSSYEIPGDSRAQGNAYFDSRGGTPFYACIQQAVGDLNAWSEPNMYPIVIGLTDGSNNWAPSFSQYLPQARGSGIPIYTVGLGAGVVTRELYDIAEASNGGKYYFASSAAVLNKVFQRIASDIGGGASRSIDETGPSTTSRDAGDQDTTTTNGRAGSRTVRALMPLNPVGGEKWGISTYRNVTWACRSDTQANCAKATLQLSINGGGWNTVASNVGTRLDYPGYHSSIWYRNADGRWYPRWSSGWVEVFNYNWTVPDVVSNNVRLRVCISDGGQICSSTAAFEIFDMGIRLGGGGGGAADTYYLTTDSFRLVNYEKATLTFWQRYDLLYTENGGVIQVGTAVNKGGPYLYEYASPTQPYTGNLRLDKTELDDYGNEIRWAWNGRSGGGTFAWEHAKVDLTPFIDAARPWVKIQFKFFTWGFGNGGSWWLDDVRVTVKRSDSVNIAGTMDDQWEFFEWNSGVDPVALQPHSGTHMWWNHNPAASNDTKGGIDNSLYSKSIDLTNAKDAYVSAYFKFNYDDDAGRPPDGFRTEVSNDNGVTWRPINLGVRSSWGISGDWSTDGKSPSGNQAYTGIQDNGADSNVPVWVEAGSLWRLNTNISGWAGSVIKLRFRVVTNLDATHYETASTFRGFAVDDVIIRGNTTISSAPLPPDMGDYDNQRPNGDGSNNDPERIGIEGSANIQAEMDT